VIALTARWARPPDAGLSPDGKALSPGVEILTHFLPNNGPDNNEVANHVTTGAGEIPAKSKGRISMNGLSKVRGIGRLSKVALALGGVGVAGVMAASPAFASSSVARNQITTSTYEVTVNGAYGHSYTVTSACGDVTGTGQYPASGTPIYDESFMATGSPAPGAHLTFTAAYSDPSTQLATGYRYSFTGTFTDAQGDFAGTITDSLGQTLPASGNVMVTTTNYANHGQYVSANNGKDDDAHSCIGMPVQSQK
jgi:hypothetical protein